MDNVIVILGSCLLVLGIILAVLMITIISKLKSVNFSNNNKDVSDNVISSVNNDELIAVITAAVSMYYIAESGVVPMFRVKSIKKANRR
ncbi:MAG TPA: hypothetical protein VIL26_07580 [Clostridia bacterium]